MPSIFHKTFFAKLSAAERTKLADAIESASPEDRAKIVEVLMPLVKADEAKKSLAMTKHNWSSMERMQLKTTLANLGVID